MERTSKLEKGEIRWIKTGGGSFRMKNQIIKPGQKFVAKLEDIPESFRDVITPLSKIPKEELEQKKAVEATYSIKHRAGKWYDVVDANGKVMTEKAKTREDALELIKTLE